MDKYTLSNLAEYDLVEIYEYSFQNFGYNQAEKYSEDIISKIEFLAENIFLGKIIESSAVQNLRKYIFKSHSIYYQIRGDEIHVIRILNNKLDHSNFLN